jgi:hypothetical protein
MASKDQWIPGVCVPIKCSAPAGYPVRLHYFKSSSNKLYHAFQSVGPETRVVSLIQAAQDGSQAQARVKAV